MKKTLVALLLAGSCALSFAATATPADDACAFILFDTEDASCAVQAKAAESACAFLLFDTEDTSCLPTDSTTIQ